MEVLNSYIMYMGYMALIILYDFLAHIVKKNIL